MKLDLWQIASAKARRKRAGGGLGYLFARIQRELDERWALAHPDQTEPDESRVLLDFDGADFRLGEALTIRRVSLLESQAAGTPDFFGHEAIYDGIVIGPHLAWLELETILTEALRTLRPGGTLLFCTFGPDTLAQLWWAWHQVDRLPHIHPFIDMHHIGDQLLQSGFTRPIMDVDRVTVEYQDAGLLYADLRAEGFINILSERRKTLTGKTRFDGYQKALESLREPGGPLAITFELIYGVATAPQPRTSQVRVAPPKIQG